VGVLHKALPGSFTFDLSEEGLKPLPNDVRLDGQIQPTSLPQGSEAFGWLGRHDQAAGCPDRPVR
jgi:hypothetical protein